MTLDPAATTSRCADRWERDILPALQDYIRIPNVSPAFDPTWADAGHMDRAVALIRDWLAARAPDGATVEEVRLPGRTPVLLVDVPPTGVGATDDTVLLYGHLDKQPPMEGWREGLGPWTPVVAGDRLYGRGGGDDGYAAFAALTAIDAVRSAGGAHARCVVLIEASEESGSPDLPPYIDHLGDRIGSPSLVVCLDSGSNDDRHLWVTASLRGLIHATLRVQVLRDGVHSGSAGGIVPSSFRVLRTLLDRIEDADTGELLLPELHTTVPEERRRQIAETADLLGDIAAEQPFVAGMRPQHATTAELLEANWWGASLAVIGAGGLPGTGQGGNVLRPWTSLDLAIRVPPRVDARAAAAALTERLTSAPPYGAQVQVEVHGAEDGWEAPPTAPWLAEAVDVASRATFGGPARVTGEGGSIPFMAMLGERFPAAQFLIVGVLVPGSNAHGPNEFLHLPTARNVTAAVALVLDAHARRGR
ncbi:MAG: M20/M25/M40 family metallo-hydrolase [Acidimicrobiales bacterium]|jgi:acetylornithine deacetylase/succinyl-diaminopimelate desuccinylase-like protein|nr:M20/M25/M40 family metallo-hydrolase [Acidimicrobiales bacterium]